MNKLLVPLTGKVGIKGNEKVCCKIFKTMGGKLEIYFKKFLTLSNFKVLIENQNLPNFQAFMSLFRYFSIDDLVLVTETSLIRLKSK